MDLEDNLSSKRSIQKDDSERFDVNESETSEWDATEQSKINTQIKQIDVQERINMFMIKNYEIAQNFMKGRQCGKENTPSRKGLSKNQKSNLSKIKTRINFNNAAKAWEEDETQISGVNFDKIEVIKKPNITKILKIKTDLKQNKKRIHKKRKNVRKSSKVRNDRTISNGDSARFNYMPPLPVSIKSKFIFNVLNDRNGKNINEIDQLCQKHLLKQSLRLWRGLILLKELNVSSPTVASKHFRKPKKKVSEYVKQPFSLLLINPSKKKPKENHRLKSLVDEPDMINKSNLEDEKEIIQK